MRMSLVLVNVVAPTGCPIPDVRPRYYFAAMVGFTQPFFITPCDGRKLR